MFHFFFLMILSLQPITIKKCLMKKQRLATHSLLLLCSQHTYRHCQQPQSTIGVWYHSGICHLKTQLNSELMTSQGQSISNNTQHLERFKPWQQCLLSVSGKRGFLLSQSQWCTLPLVEGASAHVTAVVPLLWADRGCPGLQQGHWYLAKTGKT